MDTLVKKYEKVSNHCRHPHGVDAYLSTILGNKFSEYRTVWEKVTKREIVTDFPSFTLIETSFPCNYNCIMCHQSDANIRKQLKYTDILSMELFKRIVDECAEHKCPSMSLNNNNEPLLDKKIIQRLSYASKKGILDTMMNTNALLLDEETSKALIDNGLTRLLVSMDAATEKTYTKIRSKHYNKVVKNIEKFLEIRDKMKSALPVLRLSFVVINLNEDEQETFLEIWKDKADQVTFQRYTPPNSKKRFLELNPVSKKAMHFTCSQPFERAIVRGNGNVYPCCYQSMELPVGNITEKSLFDIWNSREFNEYRRIAIEENWEANSACKVCSSCR